VVPGVVQHAALRGQLRADLDAGALGGLEVPCDLISQPVGFNLRLVPAGAQQQLNRDSGQSFLGESLLGLTPGRDCIGAHADLTSSCATICGSL
jgi:hypothetical protein